MLRVGNRDALLFCLILCFNSGTQAAVDLATADYLNRTAKGGTITTTNGTAINGPVSFFSGNVGSWPGAPNDQGHGHRLVASGFGQPVQSTIPRKPDFYLGQIISNGGSIAAMPAESIFTAANGATYASAPGYVTVWWTTTVSNTYLIAGLPGTNPVCMYLTDSQGELTGAPAVNIPTGVKVVPHYNPTIHENHLALAGNKLRATNATGQIVLELRDSANKFLAVEVLQIKSCAPDYTTNVEVGSFLAPHTPLTNHIAPVVCAGLAPAGSSGTYYAVQYTNATVASTDQHFGDVFVTQPTPPGEPVLVFWFQQDLVNIAWPCEMDAYQALDWPADFEQKAQRLYWTWNVNGAGLGQMGPPVTLDINEVPQVTIHYSLEVPPLFAGTNTVESWNTPYELRARGATGRLLLDYTNPNDPTNSFLGFQFVRVVAYSPDVVDDWAAGSSTNWFVGDALSPATKYPDMTSFPLVRKGLLPNNTGYVYQHTSLDTNNPSPMAGIVFAIRPTDQSPSVSPEIEIFWERTGFRKMVWPYEMHRYTARWPTNQPAKYQLFARGTPPNLGANVVLPKSLGAALMPWQEPPNHAALNGNVFFTSQPAKPGNPLGSGSAWSLLQYAFSNAVAFQVVRSVAHDDPAFFDLSLKASDIGQEIANTANPAASRFGYIYVPPALPHDWDRYDPEVYDGTNADVTTGQIFPVNKGKLEVWWSTTNHPLSEAAYPGVVWPSIVLRYTNWWPAYASNAVIASRLGTPTIISNSWAYYQNDPALPGFNPNEEQVWPTQGAQFYPLRCDLNRTGAGQYTSEPYILIRGLQNNLWQYHLFKVAAEGLHWDGHTYTFSYPAEAGNSLTEPTPLDELDSPVCPQTKPVSGPWWQGKNKQFFFARSAGNDGHSTTNIVMQYYYRIRQGFYFPEDYVASAYWPAGVPATNQPPDGTPFPWLDLYAQTPGKPQNVAFVVSWPTNVALLSFGETLFAAKPSIGREEPLPAIAGWGTNVAILYDQAMVTSGVPSVQLILPTNTIQTGLTRLPSSVAATTNMDYTVTFPELPPDLNRRLWWDGPTATLRFKGAWATENLHGVAESTGYLLLNVITARDLAQMLALSTNNTPGDTAYRAAVTALGGLASQVMVPGGSTNQTLYDNLALSAGNARSGGYVTLVFGDSADTLPALQVIEVGCPSYIGDVENIPPPDPFSVKQTMQYSGDFGGHADQYLFEWQRTLPDAFGNPDAGQWNDYATGPGKPGVVNVTVQGAGPDVLVSHYFRCRYRPANNPLCKNPANPLGWSDWSDATLAEGWITRILSKINLFDQRFSDYTKNQVNTIASMLAQAGPRWIGQVPLNESAQDLPLIQIYETVLKRGQDLSIDNQTYVPGATALATNVNRALMDVAGRLADLYMLFGNEAYAEATDPTVSFGDKDTQYADTASSIFCFEGDASAPTLLDQELALLRGRDDTFQPSVRTYPIYNRLMWNISGFNVDGTVAYVNTYCGGDPSTATTNYPQGHGDAWGHYLTALGTYYGMFRNPKFTMEPALDVEPVLVGGVTETVGLMHERKFARAAAAKAQTGQDIVNLTYRRDYEEDPAKQWQGYYDVARPKDRAWGVSEWAQRACLGAYFDWVTGNAILPHKDSDPSHMGTILQVDRTTVTELGQIASLAQDTQSLLDNADQGLNPLGLAKDMVPMDIDPSKVQQGTSHFEQVFNKAVGALNNTLAVFNYARQSTQALRQQADDVSKFQDKVADQEADFNNRLIEIFGTPYPQDPSYADHNVPDTQNLHFNYVDYDTLTGVASPTAQQVTQNFFGIAIGSDGTPVLVTNVVTLSLANEALQFVKPPEWTQPRASPGEIQTALGNLLQANLAFRKALLEYDNLINQMEDEAGLLLCQYGVNADEVTILKQGLNKQSSLNEDIYAHRQSELDDRSFAQFATSSADAMATMLPTVNGIDNDYTSPIRGAIKLLAADAASILQTDADEAAMAQLSDANAKESAKASTDIELTCHRQIAGISNELVRIQQLVRQEPVQRVALDSLREAILHASENYRSVLAKGVRLLDDRTRFRAQTAEQVQQYRYKDMAFRIFRDDGLQKFNAQFDLAARYVYLAAKAYDFETCFLPGDPRQPGANFMRDIIRTRALGLIANNLPLPAGATGDPGLADALARMWNNWYFHLNGQLGINNLDHQSAYFSLRSELFRVQTNQTSSVAKQLWRQALQQALVPDLFALPEFKRFCAPPNGAVSPLPGLVLFFPTTVKAGQNFFGWPLGGGDSYFNPSAYATKIYSVGLWFANYDGANLTRTPFVYLIPVGSDFFYAPGSGGQTREFKVLEQALPTPPLSVAGNLNPNTPGWIPIDSLGEPYAGLRQYTELLGCPDSGSTPIDKASTSTSRLIGRSVWNTRWMLIVPAISLGGSPTDTNAMNNAMQTFINGVLRDGNGVSDIKLLMQTYTYTSN